MDLLFGHDETVMDWVKRKDPTFHTPRYAIGILKNGVLRGAVMIVEQTNHTADLGIVSEVPPGPGIARQMFELLFNVLEYSRVEITISRSDTKSRKAAPKWGFKYDGTAYDYWGTGSHAVRFVMLKDNCPYLRKRHGKQIDRYEQGAGADGSERREAAVA